MVYSYENMKVIKNMIRKPNKPFEPVIMRYNETELLKSTESTDGLLLLGSHNKGPLLENTINPQFSRYIYLGKL